MNIQQLIYFLNIADSRSMNKSALNLFVSQSALSRSTQALEQEMGCKLLYKSKKGVELTEKGKLFYLYAQNAILNYNAICKEMHEAPTENIINIAFPGNCNLQHCAGLIYTYQMEHPQLQMYVKQLLIQNSILELLLKDEADFLLGSSYSFYKNLPQQALFDYCCLAPLKWHIYLSATHRLAEKEAIAIADCPNAYFLINDEFLREHIKAKCPTANIIFAEGGKTMMLDFAANGELLYIGPAKLNYDSKMLCSIPITDLLNEDYYLALWRKGRRMPLQCELFKQFLLKSSIPV